MVSSNWTRVPSRKVNLNFSDFEKQRQIMVALVDAFKESIDAEASQVAILFFHCGFEGQELRKDYSVIMNYLKAFVYKEGGTATHIAFESVYQLFEEQDIARTKDKAVRSIIFVLTDGKTEYPYHLPPAVKKVRLTKIARPKN